MYKRGDLVWAKMKGFPPWPGIIATPPEELKKQPAKKSTLYHCIFFFGSNNYSWIESHKLVRYKKEHVAIGGKRSAGLREAITAIDAYIETGKGSENFDITPEVDIFDKLLNDTKASGEMNRSPLREKQGEEEGSDIEDRGNLSDSSSGSSVIILSTSAVNLNRRSFGIMENINVDSDNDLSNDNHKDMSNDKVNDKVIEIIDNDTMKNDSVIDKSIEVPSCSKDVTTHAVDKELDKDTNLNDRGSTSKDDNNGNVEEKKKRKTHTEEELRGFAIKNGLYINLERINPKDLVKYRSLGFSNKHQASHPEHKKKKVQQVAKARPFRHVPKFNKARPVQAPAKRPEAAEPSTSVSKKGEKRSKTSSEDSSEDGNSIAKKKKHETSSDSDTIISVDSAENNEDSNSSYLPESPDVVIVDRPLPNVSTPTLLGTRETLRVGFLGLGIMGSSMVKNLLAYGHRIIVWNRTPDKCREFTKAGAEMAATPQDVCSAADIIFSCVAGPKAAKEVIFGDSGALAEMNPSKGYVEMTSIDTETSLDIHEAITSRGARYLEAQIQGSLPEAKEGRLVILCAGDRSLFDKCQSCFEAIGYSSFFFGEVGHATRMNLIIQMMNATAVAGLAEGMALLDRMGLLHSNFLDIINVTPLKSELIMSKARMMKNCSFPTNLALNHMQKDLRLGINGAEDVSMPTPIFAAVNESFKHSQHMGYGDHDVAAIYLRSRY